MRLLTSRSGVRASQGACYGLAPTSRLHRDFEAGMLAGASRSMPAAGMRTWSPLNQTSRSACESASTWEVLTCLHVLESSHQHWAHGVVVSHPLRMRKALGSNPSVSTLHALTNTTGEIPTQITTRLLEALGLGYFILTILPTFCGEFHNFPPSSRSSIV